MCFRKFIGAFAFAIALATNFSTQAASVLSYHNDSVSSGVNSSETTITPANITVNNFAKRYATTVDGQVYAQPLYKPGVTVSGGSQAGVHNLVFVATQHDSLYAIDADSGTVVWQTSFLANGLTGATSITPMPSGDTGSTDTAPEIGICGTPVIDPATNLLYAAAKTKQIINNNTASPHYIYTLYKIDITNGNTTANANIVGSTIIGDTIYNGSTYTYRTSPGAQDPYVVGTGDGTIIVNGQNRVYFNAMRQMNRPGLILVSGRIYIAFASHGDNGPYHGWLLGFDKSTLALAAALNLTPNGGLGGIWQAGGIPTIDASGNFYFETGNGTFDGFSNGGVTAGLDAQGFPVNGNYGDCFVKVALDATTTQANQNKNGWGLKVVDYFSPFNNQTLNNADTDLGSGGPIVLPDSVGSVAHPHLLIGSGKEGKIYLIDRDSMGKFNANTDNVIQTQAGALTGAFDTPAFFNGLLYYVGPSDAGKAFSIANGAMSTTPVKTTPDSIAWPGSTPSISANGITNGVVWLIDRGTNQLRAYSANDFSSEIWTSAQAAGNRDLLGTVVKFSAPTVADGHVFVGTSNTLVDYGPPQPPTSPPAAPTSLVATTISGLQIDLAWVDQSNNEDGFKIEQSPDGTNFTEIATVGVNVQNYSVVNLQASTTYYFRVRAFNSYQTQSFSNYTNIASTQTTSQPATLNFNSGFTNSATSLNYNGSAKIFNGRAELTDGNSGEAGSMWSKTVQDIRRFSAQFTFQITNPNADGFTFAIQNNNATIVGNGGGSLGYATINHSIALKFDIYPSLSTTGLYVNGTAPGEDANAVDVTPAGLDFHSGHVFFVSITYNGTTLAETITDTTNSAGKTYTYTIDIPTTIGSSTAYVGFTGGTGGQTATQDIISWTYTPLPSSPPTAPTNLTAAPASGTQINLAWMDNSTNEDGFKIERKIGAGGTYAQLGVVGTNQTMYFDTSLNPNTTYFYRIRATNTAGDSAYSNEVSATTPVQPLTPTNAHAVTIDSTQISMAWTDNATNEDAYKILRKITTASNFAVVATLPPNTTTYTDSGLSPGTTYDYHIQAFNLAGYSDFSGFTAQTLPTVTLAATDADAQEATSNTGTFTLTRAGETTTALTVFYTQASGADQATLGTRFTLSPAGGSATIPTGSSSATIVLSPLNDTAVLGTQNITLNLTSNPSYVLDTPTSGTVQLLDSFINVWKLQEFGDLAAAQSPAAADNAAPAGDGVSNLEKYALGLHPNIAYLSGTPGLPFVALDSTLGNRLTLTFQRPRPAPSDITYTIESLGDLRGSWTTLSLLSGYPLDNGNGTETLKAADTETTNTATKRFIRLRVSRP